MFRTFTSHEELTFPDVGVVIQRIEYQIFQEDSNGIHLRHQFWYPYFPDEGVGMLTVQGNSIRISGTYTDVSLEVGQTYRQRGLVFFTIHGVPQAPRVIDLKTLNP